MDKLSQSSSEGEGGLIMIKSPIIYFFVLWVFLFGTGFAGGMEAVELKDGSVISGEIISFHEGVFTIRSAILGNIKIDESEVRLIRLKPFDESLEEPIRSSNSAINSKIHRLQKSIAYDQKIMKMIFSLQNDPDIQELLQDSVIMNAVNSSDIPTLMSNPKFMKILEKPTIQQIQAEIAKW
jgi:hypothetical protein